MTALANHFHAGFLCLIYVCIYTLLRGYIMTLIFYASYCDFSYQNGLDVHLLQVQIYYYKAFTL
jgi:hypothetical protein